VVRRIEKERVLLATFGTKPTPSREHDHWGYPVIVEERALSGSSTSIGFNQLLNLSFGHPHLQVALEAREFDSARNSEDPRIAAIS
jgi:hypothetical protein